MLVQYYEDSVSLIVLVCNVESSTLRIVLVQQSENSMWVYSYNCMSVNYANTETVFLRQHDIIYYCYQPMNPIQKFINTVLVKR